MFKVMKISADFCKLTRTYGKKQIHNQKMYEKQGDLFKKRLVNIGECYFPFFLLKIILPFSFYKKAY